MSLFADKEAVHIDLSGKIESAQISGSDKMMSAEQATASAPGWLSSILPSKASVAQDLVSKGREGLKPWREFLKTDKFKLPRTPTDMGKRVVKNIDYFKSNYLCVFVILLIYCILTSPLLLVALVVCFGALYIIRIKNAEKSLTIGGRQVTPGIQYLGAGLLSFPIFWLAGAGSAVFWVIGASVTCVLLHAFSYQSEPIAGGEFEMETV